jgi:hypothetical protein
MAVLSAGLLAAQGAKPNLNGKRIVVTPATLTMVNRRMVNRSASDLFLVMFILKKPFIHFKTRSAAPFSERG